MANFQKMEENSGFMPVMIFDGSLIWLCEKCAPEAKTCAQRLAELFGGLRGMKMNGEFWADDTGELIGADGDIGDYNHEAIALDFLCRHIFDAIDFPLTTMQEEWCRAIESWGKELREFLECSPHDQTDEIIKEQIRRNFERNKLQDPEFKHKWMDEEVLNNAISAAFNYDDPRLYMVRHEGWIRILGNNLEIWKVTAQTLDVLATAIYNINQEKPHRSERFVLESRGDGICYNDVTYAVIERADMQALEKFKM